MFMSGLPSLWVSMPNDLRWHSRRSSQSILKEISPGISLEGMMLKLKLQYFGHLMSSLDCLQQAGLVSLPLCELIHSSVHSFIH